MMKKRWTQLKMTLVIIVCGFMGMSSAGFVGHGDGYGGGSGLLTHETNYTKSFIWGRRGEYTVSGGDLEISNAAYSDAAKGAVGDNSFQTFCVEYYEANPNGETLDIWVSTEFMDTTSPGSHSWAELRYRNVGRDLAPETAWLYTQWAKGILDDYDYTPGFGRGASANSLQQAIWTLQGQSGWGPNNAQANAWVAMAQAADWDGIGDVRILQTAEVQTYKNDVNYSVECCPPRVKTAQDMLYCVPEPATMILLAVGGLLLRKRDQRG